MTESLYEILGVPEDASEDAITDAYRKRVKEVHPDVSDREDAAEQFQLVKKAEEVLTDEQERSRYDRLGHESYMARGAGNAATSDRSDTNSGGRGFDDIRDAAAWASENTGRSGPTNQGADAGWRQREQQRHNDEGGSWNLGGEGGWNGGGDREKQEESGEDWDFGGPDWDLGSDDWDLGANWGTEDEDEDGSSSWTAGNTARDSSQQDNWNARQRNKEKSGRNGRGDPFAGTDRSTDSWSNKHTTTTDAGATETDSATGVSTDDFGRGADRQNATRGPHATASTDGGKATARDSFGGTGPGAHAAETQWGADDSSYTVNDWTEQPDTVSRWFTWPDLQDDNLGLLLGTFFMIPLMLMTSVFPPFPLPINVALGLCTLLVTGYLITRPSLGIVVFAPWAVMLPLGLSVYGLELYSPLMLSALVGTWVPLAYSLLISFSLSE